MTLEGTLAPSPWTPGRFYLDTAAAQVEFTCGDALDVRIDGRWCCGLVEHSSARGYYHVGTSLSLSAIADAGLRVRRP